MALDLAKFPVNSSYTFTDAAKGYVKSLVKGAESGLTQEKKLSRTDVDSMAGATDVAYARLDLGAENPKLLGGARDVVYVAVPTLAPRASNVLDVKDIQGASLVLEQDRAVAGPAAQVFYTIDTSPAVQPRRA